MDRAGEAADESTTQEASISSLEAISLMVLHDPWSSSHCHRTARNGCLEEELSI
jgi:hypothetical protein